MEAPGVDVRIRQAIPDEWERVRELRLRALEDAPEAFGSTLAEEQALGQRDDWVAWITGWEGATNVLYVADANDRAWVGMAGARDGGRTRRAGRRGLADLTSEGGGT